MRIKTAIILYGRAHFYRRPEFTKLIDALRHDLPDHSVQMAYEDMVGPALPEVIDALAATGIDQITVVPCGLPADLSLTRWLPGALKAHVQDQGLTVAIRITPPVEGYLDFGPALRLALDDPDQIQVDLQAPSMGKAGWTEVPSHNLQVFFCVGARCAHRGAHAMFQHLRRAMRDERGVSVGPRRVMCARASCLFPCNQGPLMVVHPEGVWYGGLTPARLDQIVQEHFLNGRIVKDAVIHHHPWVQDND